jgi:hypothetical protein
MVRVHFKVVTLVIDDICSPDVVDRGYEQLGEAIYMIVNNGHGTLDVSTIGHMMIHIKDDQMKCMEEGKLKRTVSLCSTPVVLDQPILKRNSHFICHATGPLGGLFICL